MARIRFVQLHWFILKVFCTVVAVLHYVRTVQAACGDQDNDICLGENVPEELVLGSDFQVIVVSWLCVS